MARIFVSHSSKDNSAARQLFDWLLEHGFDQTFLDFDEESGISPGADWERKLYREIERSQAVLIIVTKNWLSSKWCFAEFAQARALGKAVFPLIETPRGDQLIGGDLQAIDLTNDREVGLRRLSRALTEIALQAADGFELPDHVAPFPGLNAFEEKHAAVFFGRDDVLVRLIEILRRRRIRGGERLVALLGASGSGKSSLLRAGLVPRIKRDRDNWIALPPFRPELDPYAALVDALLYHISDPDERNKHEAALAGEVSEHDLSGLARFLRRRFKALEAQVLIPVDQGEELFTTANRESVQRFWDLMNLLLSQRLPFVAVIALRSDHLGDLQTASGLTVPFDTFSLEPLPLDRVGMLIRGPARVVGLRVDDNLVAAITSDAATPDALPLLAFTLRELFDRHGRDGDLTLAAYESLGSRESGLNPLESAIRTAASAAIPDADLQLLHDAFIPHLVRVNADGEFVRRSAPLDAIPPASRPLVERLVDARLLVRRSRTEGDRGQAVVEVAHEALFRVWPMLAECLNDEREYLISKQRVETALEDWRKLPAGQRDKGLLTGVLLDRARLWLHERSKQLTEDERQFICDSVEHETRRQKRIRQLRRIVTWGSVAAALVLGVLTILTLQQRNEAVRARDNVAESLFESRAARSRFLADLSRKKLEAGRIGDAIALARLAVPIENPQWPRIRTAENALSLAVQTYLNQLLRPEVGFIGHTGTVRGAILSPDERRVLTWSHDRTARLWDAQSGDQLQLYRHEAGIRGALFTANGKRIVTWSFDRTARIWGLDTDNPVATLQHQDVLVGTTHSDDQRRVLTWSYDHTARLWDATTGQSLGRMEHDGVVRGARFFDGSERILTWSFDGTARIWNGRDGRHLFTLSHEDGGTTDSAALSLAPKPVTMRGARILKTGPKVLTWGEGRLRKDNSVVVIWDPKDGKEIRRLTVEGSLSGVDIADDEKWLLAMYGKTTKVWDIDTGETIDTIQHDKDVIGGRISSISAKPTRVRLALCWTADKGTSVWGIGTGTIHGRADHTDFVAGAEFNPSQNGFISWSHDGSVKIFRDIAPGPPPPKDSSVKNPPRGFGPGQDPFAPIAPAPPPPIELEHQDAVAEAWFSSNGQWVWTKTTDGAMRVWPLVGASHRRTGQEYGLLQHEAEILSHTRSNDGSLLLTTSADGTARLSRAGSHEQVRYLKHDDAVRGASFNSDGTRIVSWSADRNVRVWEASAGNQIAVMAHDADVIAAEFAAEDAIVVTTSKDDAIRVWQSNSGTQIATIASEAPVKKVIYEPEQELAAILSKAGEVVVFNCKTGQSITTLEHPRVSSAHLSAQTNRLVTTSREEIRAWNLSDGALVWKVVEARDLRGVLVSWSTGRFITSNSFDQITFRDLGSGDALKWVRARGQFGQLELATPEGKRAVTTDGRLATLWDVATGEPIATLEHQDDVRDVTFLRAPECVVTLSGERNLRLWSLVDGRLLHPITHSWRADRVIPLASGEMLGIVEGSGSVRPSKLWMMDPLTGQYVARHETSIPNHALSPSGDRLAVWDGNGSYVTVRPMSLSADRAGKLASDVASRLRPLSKKDRCEAFIDSEGCEGVIHVSEYLLAVDGDAFREPPKSASSGESRRDMEVELVVNSLGEVMVMHNKMFSPPIKRVDVNRQTRHMMFVHETGVRTDYQIAIHKDLMKHIGRQDRILLVLMDEETLEPVKGGYFPLLVE